jgi:hypothetical protein
MMRLLTILAIDPTLFLTSACILHLRQANLPNDLTVKHPHFALRKVVHSHHISIVPMLCQLGEFYICLIIRWDR